MASGRGERIVVRVHLQGVVRTVAAVLAAASVHADAAAADPGARRKAGSCAAFVKRVQQASKVGIVRPDLYEGLSGWIAMKGGLAPDEVDALALAATPDASSCRDFGLAPEALRGLETLVARVPADKVRESAETCLADLRLLDELAEGPHQATLRALGAAQAKTVGRLLGFLAHDLRPVPGAVEARAAALRGQAAGDLRAVALGAPLSACEPLGVDVAQLRQAHAGR
jgi:hypothetical protein